MPNSTPPPPYPSHADQPLQQTKQKLTIFFEPNPEPVRPTLVYAILGTDSSEVLSCLHYRDSDRIVCRPFLKSFSEPCLPAGLKKDDVSHTEGDGPKCPATKRFQMPVRLLYAEPEEQGESLLSLRQANSELLWKWTKDTLTGFWHRELDDVLVDGCRKVGRDMQLWALEVDTHTAEYVDKRMFSTFTPGQSHVS